MMNNNIKTRAATYIKRRNLIELLPFLARHWYIILILLYIAGTRLYNLDVDPPIHLSSSGGLFGDETALAHNARNKALFGKWITDEWNPLIYNPILTLFEYVSFLIAGVGLIQLRSVNIIAVLIGFYLLFIALKQSSGPRIAFLSIILLGINYIFLMYNRLGLNDTFLFFPMTLTLYLWQKGLQKPPILFFAGISSFACYVTKATAIYFILSAFISLGYAVFQKYVIEKNLKNSFSQMIYYISGLIISYVGWYIFFFSPNRLEFARVSSSWSRLSVPHGLERYWDNLSSLTFAEYIANSPIELIISWLFIPFFIYAFFRNWRKVIPIEMLAFLWLIGGYVALNGLNYRPLRYFVPLIPAMCILSSMALNKIWDCKYQKKIEFNKATIFRNIFLCVVYFFWVNLFFQRLISFRKTLELGSLVLGAVILLFIIYYFIKKVIIRDSSSPGNGALNVFFRSTVVSLILLSMYHNVPGYMKWAANPKYTVIETSRELGKILDQAYIAGLWSPLATIENRHKALYVGNNWFNYRDTFKKYPVTHLFLWDGNNREELRFLKKAYPGIMERASILKIFDIKGLPIRLFKINKANEKSNDTPS